MSEENVEVVRSVYEHYSLGDFRAAAELLDPHVVLVLDPVFGASMFGSPVDEAFYGIEAVVNFTRAILEDAQVTMEAEEIVDAGDGVLVAVHQRVTGKKSGVPLEGRYFTVCRSGVTRRSALKALANAPRPSKPPGCGSRRCLDSS